MPTQEITLENAGTRITFTWRKDRYTHRVETPRGALAAAEHPEIETPVYTELHRQGDLTFLSGLSDDRHWSLSLEPSEAGFRCDAAVRARSPMTRVGSVYRSEQGHTTHEADGPFDDAPLTARWGYLLGGESP